MVDNKGDQTTKTKPPSQQPQPQPQQQQKLSSSSSPRADQESPEPRPPFHRQRHQFTIPAPLYVPSAASHPFDPQFETTPKRLRYSSATSQWKLLSPSSQPISSAAADTTAAATSIAAGAATASSSDTATSSPTHSPVPSLSAASGQETSKPSAAAAEDQQQQIHQMRKGKYVSPVWKPNEMLWLARAWRLQYQGGGGGDYGEHHLAAAVHSTRGKTRADKDREVAEFLNRQGVQRDAKTAGTKWDNMLGEFRKVYEWERGGERDRVGKSYFRLSPYERKLHRLPASFDEEVFDELSQFMGSRVRTPNSHGRSSSAAAGGGGGCLLIGAGTASTTTSSGDEVGDRNVVVGMTPTRPSLLPPPPFKDDDTLINLPLASGRSGKQLVITSGGGGGPAEGYFFGHGGRGGSSSSGALGFEALMEAGVGGKPSSKELRRIGKVRMTWEESVSLWAEEGEHHKGRVKLQGSSFLNADELTFFDDSMVACTMEAFEDGALKGFSVDKFVSGQHVKVFGRRKSSPAGVNMERIHIPSAEPPSRSLVPPLEYQDPTEYYTSCLRVPPPTLPSLFELSWYIQEPPPEELRFPLRKDVYRDLPQTKEHLFITSAETTPLDSKSFTMEVLSPIIRATTITPSSRDSFIGLWDDCINRLVSKFCSLDLTIVRKPQSPPPPHSSSSTSLQDQWPNVTGFVRNLCLWRGEETDQPSDDEMHHPSSTIVEKLMWTYADLPYILGYYAVGHTVTFSALCRSSSQIVRTDLYSLNLSNPSERMKALVPCYRIGGLLTLLADRCCSNNNIAPTIYSDFDRVEQGNGVVTEMTPNTMTRFFPSRTKWAAVKDIYDILDQRIPHAEYIWRSSERELALVFKPRGVRFKPTSCEQLVESLIYVTKALVALHDLSFMHRDLSWDKVMMRRSGGGGDGAQQEWFVCGFDEAVVAPQLYPHEVVEVAGGGGGSGRHAPEMGRGMHGVKVDVWGVGNLVRTCGVVGGNGVPKLLRELQNRCLDQNPEQRPTAADCYHHLSQLQSSLGLQPSSGAGGASY
ncbi:unnamed protein product [Linum trigynum]|uniref:Protein kinase domain-containing protein n=1 Tax=Linum trigynum TaxID=586398 RepID=A0AAV2DBY5_9ROSI